MLTIDSDLPRSEYLQTLMLILEASTWRGNLEDIDKPLSWTCCFCERTVGGMSKGWRIVGSPYSNIRDEHVGWIAICNYCKLPMFLDPGGKPLFEAAYGRTLAHVPPQAAAVYNEARRCFAASAYSAVVMLSRKLIMHVAYDLDQDHFDQLTQERNGRTPNFDVYVTWLDEHHYVPRNGKPWVDYLRERGNDENHQIIFANRDEARRLIDFSYGLLLTVYELPAMLNN